MEPTKILQIAAATVAGQRGTFVNVYGLDAEGRVWQWSAKLGKWLPHKVKPRTDGDLYDRHVNGNGHEARGGGF